MNTVEGRVQDVIDSAPQDFDTLKEISDWIETHTGEAATMNQNIQANASAISALQTAQDGMEYEYENVNIDFSTIDYEQITITGDSSVDVGDQIVLTASETGVTWESSDTNVATVSQAGVVEGVAAGTVTITASKNGEYIAGTKAIEVTTPSEPETPGE